MAMRRILLAIGLALIPAIAHAAEKPFTETTPGPEAWWLRTEYHPFDKEVRGVSVAKISRQLVQGERVPQRPISERTCRIA